MGEMKSAWEIAMEKTERLGKLSPAEIRKQKEERCIPLGKALADKYLDGLTLRQLEIELDKYEGEERELVSQAAISRLGEATKLGEYEKLERSLEGLSYLKPGGNKEEIGNRMRKLFQEYAQVEGKKREEMEKRGRETLHQLRISGEAIKAINRRADVEGQQILEEIAQPYEERLKELKRELAENC
jgi:hypothetical protein